MPPKNETDEMSTREVIDYGTREGGSARDVESGQMVEDSSPSPSSQVNEEFLSYPTPSFDPTTPPATWCRKIPPAKIITALAFIGLVIFVIIDYQTNGYVRDFISNFLVWVESNPAKGVFAFMAVYIVATGEFKLPLNCRVGRFVIIVVIETQVIRPTLRLGGPIPSKLALSPYPNLHEGSAKHTPH